MCYCVHVPILRVTSWLIAITHTINSPHCTTTMACGISVMRMAFCHRVCPSHKFQPHSTTLKPEYWTCSLGTLTATVARSHVTLYNHLGKGFQYEVCQVQMKAVKLSHTYVRVQNHVWKLYFKALLTWAVTAMVLSRFRLGTSVIVETGERV